MGKLSKVSVPGWDKEFTTDAEACAELLTHICGDCRKGVNRYVGAPTEYVPAPDQTSIDALLSTACGCEYEYKPASVEDRRASHVYPGVVNPAFPPDGDQKLSNLAPAEGQTAGISHPNPETESERSAA